MKKILALLIAVITVLAFTACGATTTLEGNIIDEKNMEITANKADDGDYMLSGQLVLEEGEMVYYDHQLESGEIEIQFLPAEGEQSAEEVPDTEADPAMTLNLSENGGGSSFFASGSYMVKVTALGDKTTGTVTLNIKPFESEEDEGE